MSSSHKILDAENDILKIMERSLQNLPTPPNPEKQKLLQDVQDLQQIINKALQIFPLVTDRFITLAKSEIHQAEQTIYHKILVEAAKLENPIHLQNLAQRLEKFTTAFQKSKEASEASPADQDRPSPLLHRMFSLPEIPKRPKVKTIPVETQKPSR